MGHHAEGYLCFFIYTKPQRKIYLVHRYVYECICGNIPKGKVVDHIDNNKKNNRTDNLQLLTPRENSNKCRCKNEQSSHKTKEIQINVTIVNVCISGSKRGDLYKLITECAIQKSK